MMNDQPMIVESPPGLSEQTTTPMSSARLFPADTRDSVRPCRIVLAKVGLDGHDRGIKVIARGLRDSGFHVIYAGIWQSPDAVAQAVADEDADWVGISLLNGAHMTLAPQVVQQLHHRGVEETGVLLGGIIPDADIAPLKKLGVTACFGPGTTISQIADFLRSRPRSPAFDISRGVDRCCHRDRRALSQLLTLLANGDHIHEIQSTLRVAHHAGGPSESAATGNTGETSSSETLRCRTVAVTGNAGVGKSSLIARFIEDLRANDRTVAVLSCDPQSSVTGGALLGDRLRMSGSQPDEGVFIRSLATPSGFQGIAPNLDLMIQTLDLFGFDVILIETVGTGQGDVAVRNSAQKVVLLVQPESGDSIQWEKAGLMEIADVIAIQKSDLPGSGRLRADLADHVNLPGRPSIPVLNVSAAKNEGIRQLRDAVLNDRARFRS